MFRRTHILPVTTLALLAVSFGAVQQASAATTSVAVTASSAVPSSAAGWSVPDSSLTKAPAAIVAAVKASQTVRIVRLASVSGHPVVTVANAVGPAEAAVAVWNAQQASGTVAVSVDTKMSTSAVAQSDDPLRGQQWALTRLKAEETWTHTRGAGETVAVIDSGVSAEPDLAAQLLPGKDWVDKTSGCKCDGTNDQDGHGTHVAGIIAAVAGNKVGVAGIAPQAKILPLRVLDGSGVGYSSDIASAVIYATDHGANVINLSLGGPGDDSVLESAVKYALSHNVVVVAAAGNDRKNGNAAEYPAAITGVLAVGATDSKDAIADFSNTGSYVSLAAPGVSIASTYPGGYALLSGTSMATPYVAGVAALVRSAAPSLSVTDVASALTSTATDLGVAGRDDAYGNGLVNPLAAVCSVSTCTAPAAGSTEQPAARLNVIDHPTGTIAYDTTVTLQAQLADRSTGTIRADHHVSWCTKAATAAAKCVGTTTNADGVSTLRLKPVVNTKVYASFSGDDDNAPVTSSAYTVAVAPKVAVKSGRGLVTVTVTPVGRVRVAIQQRNGSTWKTITSVVTDASGKGKATGLKKGTVVRAVVAATAARAAVMTAGVRIG